MSGNTDLGTLALELSDIVERQIISGTHEMLREDMTAVQEWLTGSEGPPKLTGALKASFTPYVGSAPTTYPPPDQPFYAPQGADAVDRVVDLQEPGEEVGIVSNIPHSIRVGFGGHSSKFPKGAFDIGLAQALAGSHRE